MNQSEPPAGELRRGRKPYVTQAMREHCAAAIHQWREEIGRNAGRDGPATQMEFADHIGVRVYDVSAWEQAQRLPGRDITFRLADALGVDPRAVLEPNPPHLARGVRLRAFTLKVIDPRLADPDVLAEARTVVGRLEQRAWQGRVRSAAHVVAPVVSGGRAPAEPALQPHAAMASPPAAAAVGGAARRPR